MRDRGRRVSEREPPPSRVVGEGRPRWGSTAAITKETTLHNGPTNEIEAHEGAPSANANNDTQTTHKAKDNGYRSPPTMPPFVARPTKRNDPHTHRTHTREREQGESNDGSSRAQRTPVGTKRTKSS